MPGPRDYFGAGAPAAGTSEIQTLTIGGTPTGGTFKLSFKGAATAAITWSSTNATLLANINAAVQALWNVGGAYIVATAASLTSGIGTITLTFSGPLGKRVQPTIAVAENSLTGTDPTLAVAETTPGVTVAGLNAAVGDRYTDTTNGILYIATALSNGVPTWTKVGTQS